MLLTTLLPQKMNDLFELGEIKGSIEEGTFFSWVQLIVAIFAIAGPVVLTVYLYRHGESREKNDIMRRACEAILRELQENEEALTTKRHKRIEYPIGKQSAAPVNSARSYEEGVSYTNAYLNIDAFDSILHSGIFTHFGIETQHTLSELYSRVRNHNEMITYTNEFEDRFFSDGDSDEKRKRWQKEVERYEIILTKWEYEILPLLYDARRKVQDEKPR